MIKNLNETAKPTIPSNSKDNIDCLILFQGNLDMTRIRTAGKSSRPDNISILFKNIYSSLRARPAHISRVLDWSGTAVKEAKIIKDGIRRERNACFSGINYLSTSILYYETYFLSFVSKLIYDDFSFCVWLYFNFHWSTGILRREARSEGSCNRIILSNG